MYIKPQVLVFQEFAQVPVAKDTSLRAWIVGQNANIHERGEKLLQQNGTYTAINYAGEELEINYPNKSAGSIIDLNSVNVYVDNAFVQYCEVPIPDIPLYQKDSEGNTLMVGGSPVRAHLTMSDIHAYTTENNPDRLLFNKFYVKENGAQYARNAALGIRDVQIGDTVRISGYVSTFAGVTNCQNVSFDTEVVDFIVGVTDDEIFPGIRRSNTCGTTTPTISAVSGASAFGSLSDVTKNISLSAYTGSQTSETYTLYLKGTQYKVTSSSNTDNYPSTYTDLTESTATIEGVASVPVYTLAIGGSSSAGNITLNVTKNKYVSSTTEQSYKITVASGSTSTPTIEAIGGATALGVITSESKNVTLSNYTGDMGSEQYTVYVKGTQYYVESASGEDSYPSTFTDFVTTTATFNSVPDTQVYALQLGYNHLTLTIKKSGYVAPTSIQKYIINVPNGSSTAPSTDATRYTAYDDGVHVGPANKIHLYSDGDGYSPLETGMIEQKYLLTVTGKHNNLGCKNIEFRIISESGLDNQYGVQALYGSGTHATDFVFNVTGDGKVKAYITEADFGSLTVGDAWTFILKGSYAPTAITTDTAAIYTGDVDDTYVITCTDGGTVGNSLVNPPIISYRTISGSDYKDNIRISDDSYIITALGAKFKFANGQMALNETYSFNVKSSANAAVCGLKLKDELPAVFRSADPVDEGNPTQTELDNRILLRVQLGVIMDTDVTANVTATADDVTIPDTCSITNDQFVLSNGTPITLYVKNGTASIAYREWVADGTTGINYCANMTELNSIPGPLSKDNPLKYAIYKALANSNGTSIAYTNVQYDTTEGWSNAFALASGTRDVYSIVPLTQNISYMNLAATLIENDSNEEACAWKSGYFNLKAPDTQCVVCKDNSLNKNYVQGYVDNEGWLHVTSMYTNNKINADLSVVKVGDELRVFSGTSYTSYIVDYANGNSIKVLNPPAITPSSYYNIEIWHTCNKAEQIEYITDKARSFNNRRINIVWPDIVYENDVEMPGTFLCAALAGLASGVLPHQGLTRVAVAGFDDLSRSYEYFTDTQLNQLAGDGVWIVTEDREGTIFTRHACTTATTNLLHNEEMITRNIDHISFAIRDLLDPYIGVTNITKKTIDAIRITLDTYLKKISADNYSSQGPQLTEYAIVDISQDTLLLDRLNVIVEGTVPKATNIIEFHIQAS